MRRRHSKKWERIVRAIKKRGGAVSPYAVATARLHHVHKFIKGRGNVALCKCGRFKGLGKPIIAKENPYGLAYKGRIVRTFQKRREILRYLREYLNLSGPHKLKRAGFSIITANPPPKRKIKALRLATRLAYRIYREVKDKGYAIPIPKRTPTLVKKYIKMILDANGIKWAEKNPKSITMAELKSLARASSKALRKGDIKKSMDLHYEFKKKKKSYYRQKVRR